MSQIDADEVEIKRPAPPKPPRFGSGALRFADPEDDLNHQEISIRGAQIHKLEVSGPQVEAADFQQCEISNSDMSGQLELGMTDCVVSQCGFATPVRFDRLVRVRFVDCKFSAADFATAGLVDVAFERCTFMAPSFWRSALRRVSFASTRLESADFTEARMIDVAFGDSILLKPTVNQTEVERVDASQSTELSILRAADLKGWIIGEDQIREMATAMAIELGIVVVEQQSLEQQGSE